MEGERFSRTLKTTQRVRQQQSPAGQERAAGYKETLSLLFSVSSRNELSGCCSASSISRLCSSLPFFPPHLIELLNRAVQSPYLYFEGGEAGFIHSKYEAHGCKQRRWRCPVAVGSELLLSLSETKGGTLRRHSAWGSNGISIPFKSHKILWWLPWSSGLA